MGVLLSDTIVNFTLRENHLMTRLQAALVRGGNKFTTEQYLGERLWNWRFWIQDVQIYLNELKDAVEDAEKKFPAPLCPTCPSVPRVSPN